MARPNPVRIDDETYQRLQKVADKSGTTVTEQVRRRLSASLDYEADRGHDPKLVELQELVADLALQLQLDTEDPWHSDPFAFQAFRAGVTTVLDGMRPKGEPVPPAEGGGRVFSINDPAALGRALAVLVRRLHDQKTGGKP